MDFDPRTKLREVVDGPIFRQVIRAVTIGSVLWFIYEHGSDVTKHLSKVTPFQPSIVDLLSTTVWANLEMFIAVLVIVLTFMQKQYDHSFSHNGILGFGAYISLVLKCTFAFGVLWDGLYRSAHLHERPLAIATIAVMIIAAQQIVHLLYKKAMADMVRGEVWPLILLETGEWAKSLLDSTPSAALVLNFFHRQRPR